MYPSTFEASSILSTLLPMTKTGAAPAFMHFAAQSLCSALALLAPHFESDIHPANSSATAETANRHSRRTAVVISLGTTHFLIGDEVSIIVLRSRSNVTARKLYISSRSYSHGVHYQIPLVHLRGLARGACFPSGQPCLPDADSDSGNDTGQARLRSLDDICVLV